MQHPQTSDCNVIATGTVCFKDDLERDGVCIDAYGVKSPVYATSTTATFVPSETAVSNTIEAVKFSPDSAWKTSSSPFNCSKSQTIYMTSVINATVSFNYTGKLR